ncbi:engulfment and cell motility protein 1-like [Anneissia japonica]|uniref:engulfment and cell motility protein 1-like n=1 Tax=Anneissia japonica TaxID=1529436 RepID=UPI001425A940|nr:engulfment and cell motility protein 1-like [Anneissia japonica]
MAQITPGRLSCISEIRFAVTMPDKNPQFLVVNPGMSVEQMVENLSQSWGLKDPSSYALVDTETSFYITENNRNKLRNGIVLTLSESPRKAVHRLIGRMNSKEEQENREALKQLAMSALDFTFVEFFIEEHGVQLLLRFLESGNLPGAVLAHSLTAILEIMEHGLVPWGTLSPEFVSQVTEYAKKSKGPSDATVTQKALALLELVVLNSQTLYTIVANNILFDDLIPHLSRGSEIQQCSIALMNALYLRAPPERKKRFEDSLVSKDVRTAILEKVIRLQPSGGEMLHQIYVFQQLTFNLLDKKLNMPIDVNTQQFELQQDIYELIRIAFGNDMDAKSNKYFKKLGFQDCESPINDFMVTPPGILALNCMYYFATEHTGNYTRIVLENSCRGDAHECPFGRTGIALTNLLCSILHVGEMPDDSTQTYHPMFFVCDKPFEEFFCVCIQLLNKSWRDMRATVDDLDKVLSVVKEQIEYALKDKPSTFETFRTKLTALNYSEIQRRRQQERSNKEEMDSQSAPVVELRNKIRPEIIELIKQQRLKYLMQGTAAPGTTRTSVQFFCRLSPNQKYVQYVTVPEDKPITDNEDWQTIEIREITSIGSGTERKVKKRIGFSIQGDASTSPVDIYVPHIHALDMWKDGLNALRGLEMTSEQTKSDLKTLLGMEMKLRLLDTANIKIPSECPPIPPPPSNYDFYYE